MHSDVFQLGYLKHLFTKARDETASQAELKTMEYEKTPIFGNTGLNFLCQ